MAIITLEKQLEARALREALRAETDPLAIINSGRYGGFLSANIGTAQGRPLAVERIRRATELIGELFQSEKPEDQQKAVFASDRLHNSLRG